MGNTYSKPLSWLPTEGREADLDFALNKGLYNGKRIFIHYSNQEGITAIINAGLKISDVRRNETRNGSSAGIYLCPSTHTFNPDNVFNLLFLGNDRYHDRGDWVIVFAWTPPSEESLKDEIVTQGSFARELIYTGGEVDILRADVIYVGRNPFVDVFETDSPLL